METTIQISQKLHETLKTRKISDNETYENVIWDLIEDTMELSDETKRNIAISEGQIKEGRTVPLKDVKKKLGI